MAPKPALKLLHIIAPPVVIVLAVAHEAFRSVDVRTIARDGVVYDIKGTLPISESDARL
jgi:UDP-N-acetyl-D-mannosaminuronate dehydrogenase